MDVLHGGLLFTEILTVPDRGPYGGFRLFCQAARLPSERAGAGAENTDIRLSGLVAEQRLGR
jgi:hypothetical protein